MQAKGRASGELGGKREAFFARRGVVRGLVAGLLAIHAGLLAYSAYKHSPTWDEYGHLVAGISHWEYGRFDLYRVNPPLVRTVGAIPVMFADFDRTWEDYFTPEGRRLEHSLGEDFLVANGAKVFWLMTLARWAVIPFSLIGGLVCYLWAKDLYSTAAGFAALLLWCFSPNVLGHAPLITPDAGAAAMGVHAAYLFWRWLRKPMWASSLAAGAGLGLALLSKNTWVIMPPVWLAWWLVQRFAPGSGSFFARQRNESPQGHLVKKVPEPGVTEVGKVAQPPLSQLTVIFLLAWYLLNLGYLFEGTFVPLGDYRFISEVLGGPSDAPESFKMDPRNRFAGTWVGRVPVPLPYNYVVGIDIQKWDFERKMRSYLRGEWRLGGWWYYYLYGMAIKMPLGFWLLFVLALAHAIPAMARRAGAGSFFAHNSKVSQEEPLAKSVAVPLSPPNDFFLLSPAVCVIILVSANTGFNHHLRYVLPAFPFLFIWVSQAARHATGMKCSATGSFFPRKEHPAKKDRNVERMPILLMSPKWWMGTFVTMSLTWFILHSLYVYPHSLSYFNEIVGGPTGGGRHLAGSNVDWGQDLLFLREWAEEHPSARPLYVAYDISFVLPGIAGIDAEKAPFGPNRYSNVESLDPIDVGPLPGWHAISVNLINSEHGGHAYYRLFRPMDRIGYSMNIYHITPKEAAEVRQVLGAPPLAGNSR